MLSGFAHWARGGHPAIIAVMEPVPSPQPFTQLHVMVADAGISVNEHLLALLGDVGGVSAFGCAQEPSKVIELVQAVHPDVVVLDLHSAGRRGLQMLATIKHLPVAPVVLVVSDYDEPGLRGAASGAGADGFFVKTMDCRQLQNTLGLLQQERARG